MSGLRGRWYRAALVAGTAALWPGTQALGGSPAGGGGTSTTQVTITVVQEAAGVNVCAAGATCTQTVEILNLSVVTVQTGGTLQPARIVTSPSAVNFGRIYIGRRLTRNVDLVNVGGLTAVITGEHLSGETSAFVLDPGSCAGTGGVRPLAPGGSCAVHVTFQPRLAIYRQATLSVFSPSNRASTWLEGLGVDPRPPTPRAQPAQSPARSPAPSAASAPDPAPPRRAPPPPPATVEKLSVRLDREPAYEPTPAPALPAASAPLAAATGIRSEGLAPRREPSASRDPTGFPWLWLPLLAALLTVAVEAWVSVPRRPTCGLVAGPGSRRGVDRSDRTVITGEGQCQSVDTRAWQPAR